MLRAGASLASPARTRRGRAPLARVKRDNRVISLPADATESLQHAAGTTCGACGACDRRVKWAREACEGILVARLFASLLPMHVPDQQRNAISQAWRLRVERDPPRRSIALECVPRGL